MTQEHLDLKKMNEELQELKKQIAVISSFFEQEIKEETKIWDNLSDKALENFEKYH